MEFILQSELIIVLSAAIIAILAAIIATWETRRFKKQLKTQEEADKKELNRKIYELAILKELSERTGYSLNTENIIDTIARSLDQFIDYSVVSYLLIKPEKLVFKAHLKKSVSHTFLKEVKRRMTDALSALTNTSYEKTRIEDVISGAILVDDLEHEAHSFFNIPIVIAGEVVGVLTVSDTQRDRYKEEDMTIIYKITQQASHAVTRLHDVLRNEQRKLDAMVESMNEGVVMTDNEYRLVVVNPTAKTIINYDGGGEPTIFDFIDALGGTFDIRGKLEQSITLDKVLTIDELSIGNGVYDIVVSPVKTKAVGNQDETLGGVVLFKDVTQRKEVERLREDFRSMMVHELRSPLDGIRKMTDIIAKKGESIKEEKKARYLTLIQESATNMLEMVNDLLDVAKIEAGEFKVHEEPNNIQSLIEERLAFYEATAKEAGVTLTAKISSDTPKEVSFDAHRISQVINNLLSNALKFTQSGGRITVGTFVHQPTANLFEEAGKHGIQLTHTMRKNPPKIGRALVVTISDTGIGMTDAALSHVFNKFTQFKEKAMSGDKKGTGLGLTIAKGIVNVHGGIIGVSSQKDHGSTFYFTIPMPYTKKNN